MEVHNSCERWFNNHPVAQIKTIVPVRVSRGAKPLQFSTIDVSNLKIGNPENVAC